MAIHDEMCRGFKQEWQSLYEFKANHRAVLKPRELVEWMLEDGLPVRLGLQLHKIVWDPAMRGV